MWKLEESFWNHKNFPMAMIKPFGYSHKRTVLQFACFWSWIAVTIGYHYYKYNQNEKIRRERAALRNKAETFHDDVEA